MLADILLALWFFLPAGVSNMAPVFASKLAIFKRLDYPIDFHKTYRGKPIFGPHKTWYGLIAGTLTGTLTFGLQQYAYEHFAWAVTLSHGVDYSSLPLIFGVAMGFGALAGDAIKSFFKRRSGVKPGASWFPFDQLDYIIGGALTSLLFIRLDFVVYVWIFGLGFVLHLLLSYVGFLLKLKDKPI